MDRLQSGRGNDSNHRAARQPAVNIADVLLLSQDPATLDRAATALSRHLEVQLRCSSIDRFHVEHPDGVSPDLVVVDFDGLSQPAALIEKVRCLSAAVVCVVSQANVAALVASMCGTACTILLKPLSLDEMVSAARNLLTARDRTVRLATKYRKMRELVRRAVQERRDLNSRIELVCRDLVEAHRRLTHRFVEIQRAQPGR